MAEQDVCQAQPYWLTKAANWAVGFYYLISTVRQAGRPEKYFLTKKDPGHQNQSCFSQGVNIENFC